MITRLSTFVFSALLASGALAADSVGEPGRGADGKNPLKNVYFGEQHMHTQNSFDAWTIGVRGTWAEAYEFAMGKPSKLSTTGEKMQRKTPYDFVAITDHSEYYGVFKNMADPRVRSQRRISRNGWRLPTRSRCNQLRSISSPLLPLATQSRTSLTPNF